jgi:hypothetical protein
MLGRSVEDALAHGAAASGRVEMRPQGRRDAGGTAGRARDQAATRYSWTSPPSGGDSLNGVSGLEPRHGRVGDWYLEVDPAVRALAVVVLDKLPQYAVGMALTADENPVQAGLVLSGQTARRTSSPGAPGRVS